MFFVGYHGDEATGKAAFNGESLTFDTYAEALAAIQTIQRFDPVEVERGNYYIDGPESWVGQNN